MKNEKTKKQADEAMLLKSTPALMLQELNKEKKKKDASEETMRVCCKTCFKEVAPTRRCGGHGGGGGSNNDSIAQSAESKSGQDEKKSLARKPEHTVDTEEEFLSDSIENELQAKLEKRFNPDIIADLIAKQLLVIDNDRNSMTLSLRLQCNPKALSKEQRDELKKYVEAIEEEFKEFKKEHHLDDQCTKVVRDEEGNPFSLIIKLPTLTLYDAFIHRLASTLLPTPKPELKETKKAKASTPFSMELKPSKSEEQEEKDKFNPSPLSTKLTPW